MGIRRRKQLIYGLIYLAIIGGICFGVYYFFLKPPPAPPCADCIPGTVRSVAVAGNVLAFNPLAGHAAVLAQVANVNGDYGADSFDFTVNLYDSSGTSLGAVRGTSFVYPDETKYLVVSNQAVMGAAASADLVIGNTHWEPSSTVGAAPHFTFKNVVTAPVAGSPGTLAVGGEITDDDNSAFANVTVVAIFKDRYGSPAGVSETVLDRIEPRQTGTFSVTYPAQPGINPSATEVHAYAWR